MLGGFPDRVMTTLRYTSFHTFTSTTGSVVTYRFAGNSCYDPDQTGTGGQPVNYDDFTAHYLRYRVIASRCTTVSYAPSSTTSGVQNYVLYPQNSTAASDVPTAAGQPYSISTVCHPIPTVVSQFATTQKIVGRNPRTTDALGAQYNADPADLWYWTFNVQTVDGQSTSSAYYQIVLDYQVEFFDRLVTGLDERIKHLQELKTERDKRESKRPQPGGGSTLCVLGEPGDAKSLPGAGATPRLTDGGTRARPSGSWGDMANDDEEIYQSFLKWKSTFKPP
jgi:hypothetical protein